MRAKRSAADLQGASAGSLPSARLRFFFCCFPFCKGFAFRKVGVPAQVVQNGPQKMAVDPFAEQDVQCIATNHVGRAPWQTEQRMLAARVLYGLLVRGEAVILSANVQRPHILPRLACAQLCIAQPARARISPMRKLQGVREKLLVALNAPDNSPVAAICQWLASCLVKRRLLFQGLAVRVVCGMSPFAKGLEAPCHPLHDGLPSPCSGAGLGEAGHHEVAEQGGQPTQQRPERPDHKRIPGLELSGITVHEEWHRVELPAGPL